MKTAILKKLQVEIDQLKHELHIELPKEIGTARELGDLSENAEYQAAKERQSYVRARLEQLTQQMKDLSVADFSRIPKDKIGMGSTVKLLNLEIDEEVTYTLVIAEEADVRLGKINIGSPVGKALLNKHAGDEIEVQVPGGTREFEILDFKTIYDQLDG